MKKILNKIWSFMLLVYTFGAYDLDQWDAKDSSYD